MDNYKEKYENLIEQLKKAKEECGGYTFSSVVDKIVPELRESEDEKIRKLLIDIIKVNSCGRTLKDIDTSEYKNCLAWLEKQGEKKPTNNVEPKFKVGDWCIDNEDNTIFQITKVLSNLYYYRTNEGKEYSCTRDAIECDAHLWTIQDAKDGDVIVNDFVGGTCIAIFKSFTNDKTNMYCHLVNNDFCPKQGTSNATWHPSQKEQCDLLFQKMKKNGYEWDAENKELKKIEQKQEWSEEDEKLYNSALWNIKNSCGNGGKDSGEFEVYNWLKSIKDRVQPQPTSEWSDEDEKNMNKLLKAIDFNSNINFPRRYFNDEEASILRDWLKSLKPNHWKPSKEQMEELERITRGNSYPYLSSLYQDLKDFES